VDPASSINERLCLAFDINPERSSTAIVAAGLRRDELAHVECVERNPGTGWVVQRLAELVAKHRPSTVVCDANGPAASLIGDLADAGVQVTTVASNDLAKACGVFFDLVQERRVRHLGAPELDSAVRGAAKRPLVDSWAWSRKTSKVDISPLVAATLAAWHATSHDPTPFYL
jgi:predicted Fe-Mo cluster-binding NifX family protein